MQKSNDKFGWGFLVFLMAIAITILCLILIGQSSAKKGQGVVYEVYSGASDHGVTDPSGFTNRTVYDILAGIGTSNPATLKFKHDNESGTTTPYPFSTAADFSAFTNVYWEFEPGAMLSGTTDVTLPSPAHIIAAPTQQIVSGSGTMAFGAVGEIKPGWYGFSTSASGANNATYLGNVITSMTAGSTIKIEPGSYTIAGQVTFSKACKVEGYKATFTWASDTTANRGLLVTASNVEFYGIDLNGPQSASSVSTQIGIYAYGADSSNYISGLVIEDCIIQDWGAYGIYMKYVEDFKILNNHIEDIYLYGIIGTSAQDGKVTGNTVDDIKAAADGIGITFGRAETDSLVTDPRSARVLVANNIVLNNSNWTAYDTHGGDSISFIENQAYTVKIGIAIGSSDNVSNVPTFAPLNCKAIGNVLVSGVTDGSATYGITFTGALSVQEATGIIANNIVKGFGAEATGTSGAINCHTTDGLLISGNKIVEGSPNAIYLSVANSNISIVGNNIVDPWSNTITEAIGIWLDSGTNSGLIQANIFGEDSKSATYVLTTAIRVDNVAGNDITLGRNFVSGATTYLLDDGQKTGRGLSTSQSTSGVGEDIIASQTLNANRYGIGTRLRVVAAGTKTNANDTKTLKFYFGATSMTFHAAANNVNDWRFEADIQFISATIQRVSWVGYDGGTVLQGYDAAAENPAGDITIKITGECAHADDVITKLMWMISEY